MRFHSEKVLASCPDGQLLASCSDGQLARTFPAWKRDPTVWFPLVSEIQQLSFRKLVKNASESRREARTLWPSESATLNLKPETSFHVWVYYFNGDDMEYRLVTPEPPLPPSPPVQYQILPFWPALEI